MKIAVIGTGYVGLVSGVCFAELGNEVTCVDIDESKISKLLEGKPTIYEPGLEELLKRNLEEKRLDFTTDSSAAIKQAKIVFSAVGTPMGEDYHADLQYVKQVAEIFADSIDEYTVLVTKSTVPVGTSELLKDIISSRTKVEFDVVSNPEFLKEGDAVEDFMAPDRVVVGCESTRSCELMEELYKPLTSNGTPLVMTDIKSSELIKYAANSMLATRISFMNEIARFCDLVDADVKEVSIGVGLDSRIGPKFLNAGIGYGGSCFPKDVMALVASGEQNGLDFQILKAAHDVNDKQANVFVDKLLKHHNDLKGKKIAVWGLAFKPKTDDVRDAPSYAIIKKLLDLGAKVHAFDPIAEENFNSSYKLDIEYAEDKYEVVSDSDALLLLTEWDEFRTLDFASLGKMKTNLIIDGRGIYNPADLAEAGYVYEAMGRPSNKAT